MQVKATDRSIRLLMNLRIVEGDLLDQDVDVIVNPWNRNVIPWWLLLPQGVSRVIKKRAGYGPFRELARKGPIPLGGAVLTGPGRLTYKGIIHVAGINLCWRSTRRSIHDSVRNALALAGEHAFQSIAFPVIGSGTGGAKIQRALDTMQTAVSEACFDGEIRIVKYRLP